MTKIEAFLQNAVRYIGIVLVSFLFLQSLFTLCIILWRWEKIEWNFYIENNLFLQLLSILLFFGLCVFLHSKRVFAFIQDKGKVVCIITLIIVSVFLIFWYQQTKFSPVHDEEIVFQLANAFLQGNYADWLPGGYAYMYPHQNGLVLFTALLIRIFGSIHALPVFYHINVVFYILTVIFIHLSLKLIFQKEFSHMQTLMLLLFLPYTFYCVLYYGNVIGFGWAMGGIYFLLTYLHNGKKSSLIVAALFMTFAVMFKQNDLIIFVGCSILLITDLILRRQHFMKKAFLSLLFACIFLVGIQLPTTTIKVTSGLDLGEGNTPLAWVAMGLQYMVLRPPGFYNAYNVDVFTENHFNTAEAAKASIQSIQSSLTKFYQDPKYATFFFGSKLALEWTNPSFECFAFQEDRFVHDSRGAIVRSTIEPGGKLNTILLLWFDVTQSVILFGVIIYLASAKQASLRQLFFVMLFIGGYIFFIFWEAKARYVVPYFFMLIPYSYPGYVKCVDSAKAITSVLRHQADSSVMQKHRSIYITILILIVLILWIALSNSPYIMNLFKITTDTDLYYEYVNGLIKDSWKIVY
jgi:hypothetical protein